MDLNGVIFQPDNSMKFHFYGGDYGNVDIGNYSAQEIITALHNKGVDCDSVILRPNMAGQNYDYFGIYPLKIGNRSTYSIGDSAFDPQAGSHRIEIESVTNLYNNREYYFKSDGTLGDFLAEFYSSVFSDGKTYLWDSIEIVTNDKPFILYIGSNVGQFYINGSEPMAWEFIDIGGLPSSTCNDTYLTISGYFGSGTLPGDFTRHAIYQSEWNGVFTPGSYMIGDSILGLKYTGSQIEVWKNGSIAGEGSGIISTRWEWYDTQEHNNIIFVAAIDRSREVGTLIVYKRYFGLEDGAWDAPPYNDTYMENWSVTPFIENHDIYLLLLGLVPITYNWESVSSLKGKMGIFNLTTIKSDYLNDGDPVTGASSSNFNVLQQATKLSVLAEGKTELTPTIYTDGINYLSLKDLTNNKCELKFYLHNRSFLKITNVSTDAFLSILIDEENKVAKPSIIYKNGSSYNYNQEEPSADTMKHLYEWLTVNEQHIEKYNGKWLTSFSYTRIEE